MKKVFILLCAFLACRLLPAENRRIQIDSIVGVIKGCNEDTAKVNNLNKLSAFLIDMDLYDSAVFCANQSRELANKLGYQKGIASSLRKLGVAHIQTGDYPKALDYLLQSLRINEKLGDKYEIFMLNNNIGTVYCLQGDYPLSLTYFFNAFTYKNTDAFTLSNIGWAYLMKGDYDLSLKHYEKALDIYTIMGDKNGMAGALNAIGTSYEMLGNNERALDYYFKSLELKRQIKDNQGTCDALGGVGDIFYKQKNYAEAIKYQLQSLECAKQIGYIYSVKQTEERLSQIYSELGDEKNALIHYKNFIAIRDSLYNEERTKETVRTEMNFRFEKEKEVTKLEKEKEDAIQNEKIKSNRNQRNLFIGGFSIILLASVVLFFVYRKSIKRKKIIEEQKKEVEHQKKELTDNMSYASNIQRAIIPSEEYLNKNFPEHFVIYRPKDIVSGDFYWAFADQNNYYWATADCTGHGVSGAMLTMMGSSLLNEIVIERKITEPGKVLDALREEIIKALNPKDSVEQRKDGMDISFCKLNKVTQILQTACANNSIYIVRGEEMEELRANKQPIGVYSGELKPFTTNRTAVKKGDLIYSLSDGFCDQFGGDKGKKLMKGKFKEWIKELSHLTVTDIHEKLEERFSSWVKGYEQTDDVTVFVIKV